jgi:hypothetical protein
MMRHPLRASACSACAATRLGKVPTERKVQTPPHRVSGVIKRRTSRIQEHSGTPRVQETSHDAI